MEKPILFIESASGTAEQYTQLQYDSRKKVIVKRKSFKMERLVEFLKQLHQKSKTHILTCYIIHLADIMAMLGGSGTGIDSLEHRLDSKYEKYIRLPGEEFDKLFFKIDNEFEKIKSAFEEKQLEKV